MDCTVCEQEALLQRPTLAFRTAYFVVMEAGRVSQPKMDICKNPFQTFCGSLDHWTCEQPGFLWAKRRQAPPCFPSRLRLSHQGTQTKFCVLVCVRGRGEKYTFSPAELSSESCQAREEKRKFSPTAPSSAAAPPLSTQSHVSCCAAHACRGERKWRPKVYPARQVVHSFSRCLSLLMTVAIVPTVPPLSCSAPLPWSVCLSLSLSL